jgi:hypothetical protein
MENALVDLIDVLLVVAIGFGIIMIVLPPHTAASGCGNKKLTFLRGLKGTKRVMDARTSIFGSRQWLRALAWRSAQSRLRITCHAGGCVERSSPLPTLLTYHRPRRWILWRTAACSAGGDDDRRPPEPAQHTSFGAASVGIPGGLRSC